MAPPPSLCPHRRLWPNLPGPPWGDTAVPWESVAPGSASSRFSLTSSGLACQLVLSKETHGTRKLLGGAGGHWGQGLAGLSGEGTRLGNAGEGQPSQPGRGDLLGACVFVGDEGNFFGLPPAGHFREGSKLCGALGAPRGALGMTSLVLPLHVCIKLSSLSSSPASLAPQQLLNCSGC